MIPAPLLDLEYELHKAILHQQWELEAAAVFVGFELQRFAARSRASRKGWRSRKKNEHDRIDATTEQLKAERGMAA